MTPNRVAECRKLRGYSQTQVSVAVGVARETISNIERGSGTNVYIAIRIAKYLDTRVEKLFPL